MTVFSFYLFDRSGTCLLYHDWTRRRPARDAGDDQKNMFGLLFALRNFATKLSSDGLPKYFVTDVFALHYFETPTGLRFVLTTSTDFGGVDVSKHLSEVYATVFVEYVVKNPLYHRGDPICSDMFLSKLDTYIRSLPCF